MTVKSWKGEVVTIAVDNDTCVGHGECADSCPSDVYELQEGKAVPVNIDDCVECCTCVQVCPEGAITHGSCG